MSDYIFDLVLTALLIIGLTAFNGVIANSIGEKIFGGKKQGIYRNASLHTQNGWTNAGGKHAED
ncbi:hypothetical protein [Bacillus testis]|uniref:hypothetical protein n=1 Tax=Bacillus testis TaxID=1622072 RepID=UPI00067F0510|nr:hypothetical protein [Bacillus testis]